MNTVENIASTLADLVGATHLSSAPADVDAYGGLSPLLVVWPGAPAEVAAVLKACSELGVVVCVAGYGTRLGWHWPVQGERPRIALDTRRMTNILEVDELSCTVHAQCGIQLQHLEEALQRQGLTLGNYPRRILTSTLGGILAAPSPEAHTPRSGWFGSACLGLSVAHADGSTVQTRIAPRRATGPDIARLYLGSRGGLGVITTVVLRVQRLPEAEQPLAFGFAELGQALEGARRLLEQGVRPVRLRVLDAGLAAEELGETGAPSGGTLLVVLAGPEAVVTEEHRLIDDLLRLADGAELSHALAHRWWERRRAGTGDPAGSRAGQVGVRLPHSRLAEALAAAPRQLNKRPLCLRFDEINLQGATLWFAGRSGEEPAALRAVLLDAGLDPLGARFPPLMEEFRARLDPQETLVVMEG